MDKRKVSVLKYDRVEGQTYYKKVPDGEGIFCAWGMGFEELNDGVGNFSTAVIEMPDGTVKNVPVELIVFQ